MNASNPQLVSVVIPAYNAAEFIAETLDSVFDQTYAPIEVIVVNDGSPDTPALEAALAPYLDEINYVVQANRGPGGARNTAIEAANGEYVAFIDSDDLWLPEFLSKQVQLLESGNFDLVYADAVLFGSGSPLLGRSCMELSPSTGAVTFESIISLKCVVFTSTVVARRDALLDAGLFDERFFHSEDWDLWARLAHCGGRIGYQLEVLARHRVHPTSLSAPANSLIRGQIRVCRKLIEELPVTPTQRELLDHHVEWCEAHLSLADGKQHLIEGDYAGATQSLTAANRVLRKWKIAASIVALRVAPRLLRRLYSARHASVGVPSLASRGGR